MENILVLQAARFGDLVQTKRLIQSLVEKYNVHICVDKSLGKLCELIYPRVQTHCLDFHSEFNLQILKFNECIFNNLKEIHFSKIYNCNFSPLTAAICRLFPSCDVINFRPLHHSPGGILRSSWARLFFRLGKFRPKGSLNIVDYWGWIEKDPVEPQKVNPLAKPGGDGIGVVLAGRESRRSLPPDVLASILQIICRVIQPKVIKLFGTNAEKRQAHALTRHFTSSMLSITNDLCGKTDWCGLMENLSGLDILISPDTGTMHLAAHLGIPVMAFFLSSAWCHETGPYGLGHKIWQSILPCSPCVENVPCKLNTQCLDVFKPQQFSRILTKNLQNYLSEDELPQGLQYWETDFDDLGQQLKLVCGIDLQKQQRDIIRTLLKNHLRLPTSNNIFNFLPPQEVREAIEELFPCNEWMLPNERYY